MTEIKCIHGCPARKEDTPCELCRLEIKVDERYSEFKHFYSNIMGQIHSLEKETCRFKMLLDETSGRIENIEEATPNTIQNHLINDVLSRINKIEKQIVDMRGLAIHPTKPWRCPNCEGSGRYKLATAQCASDIVDCHSCNGKGIVWG